MSAGGFIGGILGGALNMGINAGVDGQRNWTDIDPLTGEYKQGMPGDNYEFGGMAGTNTKYLGMAEDQRRMANNTANERTGLGYSMFAKNDAFQGRADDLGAEKLLQDAAMGKVPSQAEMLAQKNMDRIAAQQISQAGSARGASAMASAQRRAMENTAMAQQDNSMDTAAMRAQEMAAARGVLASQSMGLRGIGMGYGQMGMGALGQGLQAQGLAQNALGQGIGINEYQGNIRARRSDAQNTIEGMNVARQFERDRFNKGLESGNLDLARKDRDREKAFYMGTVNGIVGQGAEVIDGEEKKGKGKGNGTSSGDYPGA